MITRTTKIQLLVFVLITVLGASFVGGRYAQVDRLVVDRTYTVVAHFSDSGGIFKGAQVTYRGIEVGRVNSLDPEQGGVRVILDIEKDAPKIPSDLQVIVADKSAIGEQYVDLRPRTNSGPYLANGSQVKNADTQIPVSTTDLLVNVNDLVRSINTDSLRTVVEELGTAFEGTGDDLATILDTSSDFIKTADANIDVTRQLIRDSDSVLQTQIDKQDDLGTFSENLALLSDSLVEADPDIRRLLDKGSDSAKTVADVVKENSKDLGTAIADLGTATKPLKDNVTGLQTIFVLYPYLLEGTFSVLTPTADGEYNAAFGLDLTDLTPTCTYAKDGGAASGYQQRRVEGVISDREFVTDTDCKVANNIAHQPSKSRFNRPAVTTGASWSDLMMVPLNR